MEYWVYRSIAGQFEFINMKVDYFRYKEWTIEFIKRFFVRPFGCMLRVSNHISLFTT